MPHPLVENNHWSIMMKRYATPPGRKQLLVYNDEGVSHILPGGVGYLFISIDQ
jgi:hypothetical protein